MSDEQQPTVYDQRGQQVTTQYNAGGDITIQTRSAQEALSEYLARAIATYEARLARSVPRRPPRLARPYKFLYAFELADAHSFWGRDAATDALYERVCQQRLTVLHAHSGAGKTSLLNAGLAPRLIEDNRLPVLVRTSSDPVLAIKRVLAPPSLGPWPDLLDSLPLHPFLGLICAQRSYQVQELVLILDQCEEFFVAVTDPAARQTFAATLAVCHADATLPIRIVIGMRSDFFSDLATLKPHLPHIFHHEYRLDPMTRSEAADAIAQPLRQSSSQYAPDVLDALLDDLEHTGMELPHLQIICTRLYESLAAPETTITLEHYTSLGQAAGILGTYLRTTLGHLGSTAPLARAILHELVTPGGTRQTVSAATLHNHLAQRSDLAHLEATLAALVDARVLRRAETEGMASYELAHDYLVGTIQAWITPEDLAALQARETLQHACTNWQIHGWLLDADMLAFIQHQRERLANLSRDELDLLLRSAIRHQADMAIWALAAHRAGLDIWPLLQPVLAASDHRIRANVISILPVLQTAALPALRAALTDPAPLVRVQAIRSLERLGSDAAHQVLQTHLRYEVRLTAGSGLPCLYMDRYPVTGAAYQQFLVDQPEQSPPRYWQTRTVPWGVNEHPVTGVSWLAAQAYATWSGKRLPTAAEWQQAAGGTQQWRYPWGQHADLARCNTREAQIGSTTPVGHYSPAGDSPAGIADMAGNVWEWLVDVAGPAGAYRYLRGGSWMSSVDVARTDYTGYWQTPDQRQTTIGFRLCFDLSEEELR